jgi:hypothetical protein
MYHLTVIGDPIRDAEHRLLASAVNEEGNSHSALPITEPE